MEIKAIKRLSIDIDKMTHDHIKKMCIDNDWTMKEWILKAIADKILRDFELGLK